MNIGTALGSSNFLVNDYEMLTLGFGATAKRMLELQGEMVPPVVCPEAIGRIGNVGCQTKRVAFGAMRFGSRCDCGHTMDSSDWCLVALRGIGLVSKEVTYPAKGDYRKPWLPHPLQEREVV
jgi:hypothetical protein